MTKKKIPKLEKIVFNAPEPLLTKFEKVAEKDYIFYRTEALRVAMKEFIDRRVKA